MGTIGEQSVGGVQSFNVMSSVRAAVLALPLLFTVNHAGAAMVDIASTAGGDQYLSNQKIDGSLTPWNLLSDALTRATGSAGDLVGHELLYSQNGRLYRIVFDRLAGQIIVSAIHALDSEVPFEDDAALGDDVTLLLTKSGGYLSIDIPSGSLGLSSDSVEDESTAALAPIMPEFLATSIPEPATLGLAMLGGSMLLMRRR